MSHWKTRLAALGLGCTALLLAPVTLTALGTELKQPAYTVNTTLTAESATAPSQPSVPAAGKEPAAETGSSAAAQVQALAQAEAVRLQDPNMEEQIRSWIGTLAKEKDFEAWSDSAWDIYPLGPGTHSWVVLLRSQGTELGYMVVSSTEDGGYKLMEYGTGENPLFSMKTLYHSMVQRGMISDTLSYVSFLQASPVSLTRWYVPPLQAVWQIDGGEVPRFFDAKTGEELPDIGEWLRTRTKGTGPGITGNASIPVADQRLSETFQWEPHDPFIRPAWLKGNPMDAPTFAEWKKAASSPEARMVYSGKWYGGIALYPLAVSGYHVWPGETPYIRLEHQGSRYVSFGDAGLLGGFYP